MVKKSGIEPIRRVMVSSTIGDNKKLNDDNGRATAQLFHNFKEIINSNGELDFSLTNLEEKIVKAASGFVFLPIPKEIRHLRANDSKPFFKEMFKAASLFVGAQTKDPNMRLNPDEETSPLKPIIMVNYDGCYDPFRDLINHMHELGTITQKPEDIMKFVATPHEAIQLLKEAHLAQAAPAPHHDNHHKVPRLDEIPKGNDPEEKKKPDFSVCVFCSASTKNPDLIKISEDLGEGIAHENWGLISGMGSDKTGMMGGVVRGANKVQKAEGKGWIGGSNLPRIIGMEGLPENYDRMYPKEDIYTRMEVMIEKSQAFVIMPGGMGTVQELMALLLLKHNPEKDKTYLMRDEKFGNKPIIVVNKELTLPDGRKKKFWQPLIEMAEKFGFYNAAENKGDIIVVDTVEEAMEKLKGWHQTKAAKIAARGQAGGSAAAL